MVSGVSVHTFAAAAGISAIFYSSALAFQLVKYAGAAYLLFLAWKALHEHSVGGTTPTRSPSPAGWQLYKRGFIMNVLRNNFV